MIDRFIYKICGYLDDYTAWIDKLFFPPKKMSNKPLTISDEAKVQMPMKTVASLIALVAIGTWAYFGINEKLNQHSTKLELFEKDLQHNTEFRIKYPRGELGQSSRRGGAFYVGGAYRRID